LDSTGLQPARPAFRPDAHVFFRLPIFSYDLRDSSACNGAIPGTAVPGYFHDVPPRRNSLIGNGHKFRVGFGEFLYRYGIFEVKSLALWLPEELESMD
jgi:hypothetical protein